MLAYSLSIPLLNTQNKSNHLTAVFKQAVLGKTILMRVSDQANPLMANGSS